MKFYLAAAYPRKDEINAYAKQMQAAGLEVVSNWHRREEQEGATPEELTKYAVQDIEELEEADTLVLFLTDSTDVKYHRGGANWEAGYATASGIGGVIVGPPTTVFHYLYEARFDTFTEFLVAAVDEAARFDAEETENDNANDE